MKTAFLAVQGAIRDALTADAQFMAVAGSVYDYVPETGDYPYVEIGEPVETVENTLDHPGRSLSVTLHVWSGSRSPAEGANIAEELVRVLDQANLSLGPGGVIWACQYQSLHRVKDPDQITQHIIITFRLGVQLDSV